jgi:tRNA-Thr(GGU) m(6)t(6)A37 methyltransferase TsaA
MKIFSYKRKKPLMPQEIITYHPIGRIETPFDNIENMPIQPGGAQGVKGNVVVFPTYQQGLKDLAGFSHAYLLYHFHKIEVSQLTVTPFLDTQPRGIFSTRAPKRPNPIGLSVVKITDIKEGILTVENVDMLNGTPLLDIKPYVNAFDHQEDIRIGWLTGKSQQHRTQRSDKRFES